MQVRDHRLLDGIIKHRYLRTDQAAALYFQSVKDPRQRLSKARERLLMLYKHKLVNRTRYPNEPYIYFTRGTTRSHKMTHYLTITDVLLQILPQLPTSSRVDYDIEVKYGQVITDLVIRYRNEFRKVSGTYYVEVELDSSADIEGKIRAYEDSIDDGVLIIICKHKRTAERARAVDTDLEMVVTDLGCINLGDRSLR